MKKTNKTKKTKKTYQTLKVEKSKAALESSLGCPQGGNTSCGIACRT